MRKKSLGFALNTEESDIEGRFFCLSKVVFLCYTTYMRKRFKKIGRLFWFLKNRGENLDMKKDRNMIIHQTLALGSMDDVRKVFEVYGEDTTRKEFQKPVKGLYHPAVLEFFQYLLKTNVDKSQYIKDIYGKNAS